MDIKWYEILESTNDTAASESGRLDNLSIVATFCQTKGRGQRGNSWSARAGENLLFSILLKEFSLFGLAPLSASRQFLLSRAAALAVVEFLKGFGLSARIKWPNDIYVGDKKICGILIENTLRGSQLSRCITGIGINLGQREFPASLPNPTSVALETGREFTREQLQDGLERFSLLYERLLPASPQELSQRYESLLYRRGEWHAYREQPSGIGFEGKILGTDEGGRLYIEDRSGRRRDYAFKEVEFVI